MVDAMTGPGPAAVDTRPGRPRLAEAALLVFAVLITVAAQCIVDITLTGSVRPQIVEFSVWVAVLWILAAATVWRWAPYADLLMLPAVALLVGLGLTEIHRLDLAGLTAGRPPADDARTQLIWATLGVALFLAVLIGIRDHRILARFSYTLGLVGLVLLALPAALPASISQVNGAKL